MGFVFEVSDREFWGPSLNTGRVFLSQLKLIEQILEEKSGVSEYMPDTINVELEQLSSFTRSLLSSNLMSNKSLRVLCAGVVRHLVAFLICNCALSDELRETVSCDDLQSAADLAQTLMQGDAGDRVGQP